MNRKLRMGMVGGGRGAFIGAVHRMAANLDGKIELVAGAFSSSPEKSKLSGEDFFLDPERVYDSYQEMAEKEAAREDKIDFVSIVVQNHLHFDVAKTFLEAGFNVICDKPMTRTLEEARALRDIVDETGQIFCLTHNYTGYPMVRNAKVMCENGDIGNIRVIQAEYAQDWLTEDLENKHDSGGNKQASWRTDPAQSGGGGCIGDIGTHAFNLIRFITGLEPHEINAELTSFVSGRQLDDNAQISIRFQGGAKGTIWSSQVAPGNENHLMIRIYGDKGGLEWCQEDPNYLYYTPFGEAKRKITRGGAGSLQSANDVTRIPPGHPEGYLEGFANIYTEVADAIIDFNNGNYDPKKFLFPKVEDGLEGIRFIERSIASNASNSSWVNF